MADRGILFSAPMVRALLGGRKTQTRRLIKPQPPACVTSAGVISRSGEGQTDEWTWLSGDPRDIDTWGCEGEFRTRFRPGDRLWVRESLWVVGDGISYAATELERAFDAVENHAYHPGRDLWVKKVCNRAVGIPSIYMPRWASRLTLIIDDVRVQRLQEISEADAIAEGVESGIHPDTGEQSGWKDYSIIHSGPHKGKRHPHAIAPWKSARLSYQSLWETLNGPDSWTDNPWIVAVTFRVVLANIDQVPA